MLPGSGNAIQVWISMLLSCATATKGGGGGDRTVEICLVVALFSSNAWKCGVRIGREIPMSAVRVGGVLVHHGTAGDYVRQQLLFLCRLQLGRALFRGSFMPGERVSCGQK